MVLHWKHSKSCCDCWNPKCELNFAVSSVWNLLLKLEEGAEIQKPDRKFSWVLDFSLWLWHMSSKDLQKYWVLLSSTNFTWSQTVSADEDLEKCSVSQSECINSFKKNILYFCFSGIFDTLYLAQSLNMYLSDVNNSFIYFVWVDFIFFKGTPEP